MTDRREFVRMLGAAALAYRMPRGVRDGLGADKIPRVGLQLYTVRAAMRQDVERTLARVAQIGYREVEFAGYFGKLPKEIRAILDRLALRAPAAHIGVPDVRQRWKQTIDDAKEIGHQYLVVADIPGKERTPDGYRAVADLFNRAAEEARAAGLGFGYHNHSFEFRPLPDGGLPYDLLLERTDPKLVRFEMDLYWITVGGGDPLAYIARYPGRFPMVHVKDSGGPPTHEMRDVGRGTIDFTRIFARHEQAGIQHYFVEHDEPKDPFESITTSYEYLAKLEF